jgi:hypothetical protein
MENLSVSVQIHSYKIDRNLLPTGTAFSEVQGRLFPVIGIGDRDVQVLVNFGQSDFLYKGPTQIWQPA